MSYIQDKVPRNCAICKEPIEEYALMIDLFRGQSSGNGQEGVPQMVLWCHEKCCRTAVEEFLKRKWAREAKEKEAQ